MAAWSLSPLGTGLPCRLLTSSSPVFPGLKLGRNCLRTVGAYNPIVVVAPISTNIRATCKDRISVLRFTASRAKDFIGEFYAPGAALHLDLTYGCKEAV